MLFFIFRKPRGPLSILRAIISRRQYFKRDVETASCPARKSEKCDENVPSKIDGQITLATQAPDKSVTRTTRRDVPCSSDTDMIVNQLAVLAATVSRSSHSTTAQSKRSSSSSVKRTINTQSSGTTTATEEEVEESFHYLCSLITVSCLPQHSSAQNSTASITEEKDSQRSGRKRASSRLSLDLGELPSLPFAPKVSRKPCPRYSPLPPVWTPKPIAVRPESWNSINTINFFFFAALNELINSSMPHMGTCPFSQLSTRPVSLANITRTRKIWAGTLHEPTRTMEMQNAEWKEIVERVPVIE